MNITKQGDQDTVLRSWTTYQCYMNSVQQPYDTFKVGERVRVVVPCLTGNGQRTTFYGFKLLQATVLYVDKGKLLYRCDTIGVLMDDAFHSRFNDLRIYGQSYWFMFNSTKERLIKE